LSIVIIHKFMLLKLGIITIQFSMYSLLA